MKTLVEELEQAGYREPIVLMVVGGAFDMLSGKIQRAPTFMRSAKLEWLWRLILEPWRLGRQLRLIGFLWQVVRTYR
jgi:N-acetylglucosaminyldiphosphoundecaprenol N-acetyl-beta-D-mannosaminyltransferase